MRTRLSGSVLCRAAASWPGDRGGRGAGPGGLGLRQRYAPGGHQRRLFRQPRDVAGSRRPAVHRRRRIRRPGRAPACHAGALVQGRRGDAQLFADLPEACDNTLEIARRCAFMVSKRDPILPRFPTSGGRIRRRGTRPSRRAKACSRRLKADPPGGGERPLTGSGWSARSASSSPWDFPAIS